MRRSLIALVILAGAAAWLDGPSLGQSGPYRGPGDIVPPATPAQAPPTLPPGPLGPPGPGNFLVAPPRRLDGAGSTRPSGDVGRWLEALRSDPAALRGSIRLSRRRGGAPSLVPVAPARRASHEERAAVRVLLETLRRETDRDLLAPAMLALARIGGGDAAVDAIAPFVSQCAPSLAVEAATSLGLLAQNDPGAAERAAAVLLDLLRARGPGRDDPRNAAAIGLGRFDDPGGRIVPALESVFEDRRVDPVLRAHALLARAAVSARREEGPEAQEALFRRASRAAAGRSEPRAVREAAVVALCDLARSSRVPAAEAAEILEGVLRTARRDAERGLAAIALAEIGSPEALDALERARAGVRASARAWGALALDLLARAPEDGGGTEGPPVDAPEDLPALLARLREPRTPAAGLAAAASLARRRDPLSVPHLVAIAGDRTLPAGSRVLAVHVLGAVLRRDATREDSASLARRLFLGAYAGGAGTLPE